MFKMKMYAALCLLFLTATQVVSCKHDTCCDTSWNVQVSGTDDSQCAYVFSIPAKENGKCPTLKQAVKYLYDKYTDEDRLKRHLIGYYPFDRDTLDYSGNERDGVVHGSLSYEKGVKGKAGSFDGSSKVVASAFRNFDFGSTFSVSVWFKRTTIPNYQGIVNNGYYKSGSWEIRMGREFSGRMLGGGVITGNSVATWDYINLKATVNEWHHVAMTYDGTKLLYYLNGDPQNGNDNCCSGPILVKDTPVTIGQAGVGMTHEYFVGLIDEVKLYNITLTPKEVDALFHDNNMCLHENHEH